ncbi:PadR family transcriptional regulator [Anaerococcus lactolyticus]|uniref:Transcriptional regulator, PadR family n=2 Tax=Anaerococcus lactolyticus TaxID=33032 RepID=C2BD08_9FIRM|nr:PadR family transcriptional regulator [Anaerococcus lactolyticus]EEI87200.1 transcriptional regulator, PadR family [Anaerococcus lactolyticus ATCC 51172]KGF03048.1 PadR family transcriptional regulator [Anaerococcus lactolyticus S7-1-13]
MARDQFQTLTEPMYFTLLALGEVRNGAEITSWVEEITKGRIKLAPGTLYALLAQFLENDLIKRVEVEKKGKHYVITEEGRDLLDEEVRRLRLLLSNYDKYFTN